MMNLVALDISRDKCSIGFSQLSTKCYGKKINYITRLVETVQWLSLFRSPESWVNMKSSESTFKLKTLLQKRRKKRCCSTICIAYTTYEVLFTPTHGKEKLVSFISSSAIKFVLQRRVCASFCFV